MYEEGDLEMFHIINPKKDIPIYYKGYDVLPPIEDFQNKVNKAGLKN
jgi:hypothetical protein